MEKMDELIHELIDTINKKLNHKKIIEIQQKFTQIINDAMNAYKKGEITVNVKSLPLVMYEWAANELPIEIQNHNNFKKIKNQLVLFHNTIEHILNPHENVID